MTTLPPQDPVVASIDDGGPAIPPGLLSKPDLFDYEVSILFSRRCHQRLYFLTRRDVQILGAHGVSSAADDRLPLR